jgi:dihydroneopterin aldolase
VRLRTRRPRDSVADTVDYKTVAKRVLGWVQASQFQLVESLAHGLAMLLLAEFPLAWVRVSINKPGAIRHSRDVGVCVERRRAG